MSAPVSPSASHPTSAPSLELSSCATARGSVGPSPASWSHPTPVTRESPRKMMFFRRACASFRCDGDPNILLSKDVCPTAGAAVADATPDVGPDASGGSTNFTRTYAACPATTAAVPPSAAPAMRSPRDSISVSAGPHASSLSEFT
eukprot:scaffold664_cov129-Isochrysis_galbana.AAC.8